MSMTKSRPTAESSRVSEGVPNNKSQTAPSDSEPGGISDRVRSLRLDSAELPKSEVRSKKRWIIAGALIVVGIIAAGAYRSKYAGLSTPMEVEAFTVTMERPVEIVLDATGYIISHSMVKVSPTVPGRIEEVFIEEGSEVKRGDLLAKMDDAQYLADLNQCKAALDLANARLAELSSGAREEEISQSRASLEQAESRRDLHKKEAQRAAELWESRTIPQAEYDRAQASLADAESHVSQLSYAHKLLEKGARSEQLDASAAEVAKANAMVARAQYFVDAAQIRSPIDGTVVELVGELGEYVVPGDFNAGYCLIADMKNLEAEIDIPEQELKSIRLGQPCIVTTEAYPGEEYRGRVEWFAPTANKQKGIRRAKIKILEPDDRLLPDLTCRVQIHKKEIASDAKESLQIPKSAIIAQESQTFVYILQEEKAQRVTVQTGEERGEMIEILEGVEEGAVVLLPSDEPLADGQLIRPQASAKQNTL